MATIVCRPRLNNWRVETSMANFFRDGWWSLTSTDIKMNFQAWHSSFSWLCCLLVQSRPRTCDNSLRIKPRGGLSGFLSSPRHRVALRKQCVTHDKVKLHTQQCSLEKSRVYRQEDKTYTATLNMNSPCFTWCASCHSTSCNMQLQYTVHPKDSCRVNPKQGRGA